MARYITAIPGPFDFTFDATFPRLAKIPGFVGGQFDFTFSEEFSITQHGAGSIGGSTFQLAGKRQVIRHHRIPTLKQSTRMLSGRQIFRGNIQLYQSTNPTQKATWEAARFLYPRLKGDADIYYSNRYHLFISSNQNLVYSNQDNILTISQRLPRIDLFIVDASLSYSTESFVIDWNLSAMPSEYALQLFTSRPVPQGNPSNAKAALRLTRVYSPSEPLAGNIFSDYVATWNITSSHVGYMVLIAAFAIPISTGQKDVGRSGVAIVT